MERLLERVVNLPGPQSPDRPGRGAGAGARHRRHSPPPRGAAISSGKPAIWECPKFRCCGSGNVGFDAVLGFVPLIGDAADVLFRSNTRNLRIIRKHLDKHHPSGVTLEG